MNLPARIRSSPANLPRVVDSAGVRERPSRIGRYQVVQVLHDPTAVQKGVVDIAASYGLPYNPPVFVDAIGVTP